MPSKAVLCARLFVRELDAIVLAALSPFFAATAFNRRIDYYSALLLDCCQLVMQSCSMLQQLANCNYNVCESIEHSLASINCFLKLLLLLHFACPPCQTDLLLLFNCFNCCQVECVCVCVSSAWCGIAADRSKSVSPRSPTHMLTWLPTFSKGTDTVCQHCPVRQWPLCRRVVCLINYLLC